MPRLTKKRVNDTLYRISVWTLRIWGTLILLTVVAAWIYGLWVDSHGVRSFTVVLVITFIIVGIKLGYDSLPDE